MLAKSIKKAGEEAGEEDDSKVLDNCKFSRKDFVSSGSTLLNLACTDNAFGAFRKGSIISLIGDSGAGKTFLSMTCFAEASVSNSFKKHRIIEDQVEGGNSINLGKFFGQAVAKKIEVPPNGISSTIEEVYYNISDMLDEGKPFIYVLDSMDGVDTVADEEKFDDTKKAHQSGKTTTGTYGMAKAKANSTGLRNVAKRIKNTESIVILISQTRDNLGPGFAKKTSGGGKAIKFYSHLEIWASIAETIKKTVNGIPRIIGNNLKIKITKNRYTGYKHEITVPIMPSYGIDDITSSIDYLVREKHWNERRGKISASEFEFEGTVRKLIDKIEEDGREAELRALCGKVWKDVLTKSTPKRKSKY